MLVLDGKLLSLEDIWSMVHSVYKPSIEHDKWNFITQKVFLNVSVTIVICCCLNLLMINLVLF